MWISRDAARSDVALAPGGLVVGGGAVALLHRLPVWPSGVVGLVVDLLLLVLVMIAWPLWLARQRGERRLAGSQPLHMGDVPAAFLAAAPTILVGIVLLDQAPGMPLAWAIGGAFSLARQVPEGLLELAAILVLAAGTWLVLALVARRAIEGFSSQEMPVHAAVRTWGLGAAVATTLLSLLASVGGGSSGLGALMRGLAVAATVLVVDQLVPAGSRTTRAGLMAPMIVVVVLWVIRGWFFSDALLVNLAGASFGAGLTICLTALVAVGRPAASLLLPLAAAIWLVPILLPPV